MGKLKHLLDKVDNAARRIAYHGSPHDFDKFSLNKIGTGEGAQAYGYGLYFADNVDVATDYRNKLSGVGAGAADDDVIQRALSAAGGNRERAADIFRERARAISKTNPKYVVGGDPKASEQRFLKLAGRVERGEYGGGRLYTVEIPHESMMLDWDKPLSEQPDGVQQILQSNFGLSARTDPNLNGEDIYHYIASQTQGDKGPWVKYGAGNSQAAGSQLLKDLGIPGINYIGTTSGERNFVVFDDELIDIKQKGAIDPRLLAPTAAAAGVALAAQNYEFGTPEIDAAYQRFAERRASKKGIWQQLKQMGELGATVGSAIAGGVVGDLSRLGGYLNPMQPVEATEAGARGIEQAMQYIPSEPNAMLDLMGRHVNQFEQDIEPLAAPFRQSIPYKVYESLPERAQGIARIGADLAL